MTLPFRYQFMLAPSVTAVILIGLVAYTLFEVSKINQIHEISRQWEILNDRMQLTIVSVSRLSKIIDDNNNSTPSTRDDQFFRYLEQARIVSDQLLEPYWLAQLPEELRQSIKQNERLWREPETADPNTMQQVLTAILPALEQHHKILAAQRRSTFIDHHHRLIASTDRLTTVLLTVLIVCIALAAGLSLWGLQRTRTRLQRLSTNTSTSAPLVTSTARDELDELELQLANMTTRLVNVVRVENVLRGVEEERRRIAMDMHDGVLADLTAITRRLDSLTGNTVDRVDLADLRGEVDDTITTLRRTIDDLHPQVLETLGLESALRSFLERHLQRNAGQPQSTAHLPHYHFEFDPTVEQHLSPYHKLNLFRIITEAIHNAIKHARCDRIEIEVRLHQHRLLVTVEDNGNGMPQPMPNGGHGCANISERAQLIGATVQWRASRFSHGTCFELQLGYQPT